MNSASAFLKFLDPYDDMRRKLMASCRSGAINAMMDKLGPLTIDERSKVVNKLISVKAVQTLVLPDRSDLNESQTSLSESGSLSGKQMRCWPRVGRLLARPRRLGLFQFSMSQRYVWEDAYNRPKAVLQSDGHPTVACMSKWRIVHHRISSLNGCEYQR